MTSVANSWLNGIKLSYILDRAGFPDYKILVHGDDSLVVLRGKFSLIQQREMRAALLSYNVKLGFTTKLKMETEWPLVEYCSSLFWPTSDGYVLGPKIGKRLPKIGFSLRNLKIGEVKGMLLGLSIEASYVPVLRVYAAHQLALLADVEEIAFADKRSSYKSMAVSKHICCEETAYFFLVRYGFEHTQFETMLADELTSTLTDCVPFDALSLFTSIDL